MLNNLAKYKDDLKKLVDLGFKLKMRMQFDLFPKEMRKQCKEGNGWDDMQVDQLIKNLPSFKTDYQKWYSESLALIKQIIPDRLGDFKALYAAPSNRKEIAFGSYVMHDYLQGLSVTHSYGDEKVGPSAALPQFRIQRSILESAEARFESSLFDIAALAQADLLDDEIEAARTLLKGKFVRAAGAVSGVVLERHLRATCDTHNIQVEKAHPTISTLNDLLKDLSVIDVPQWRFIQHLADIRNLCDHSKSSEPSLDQVKDLIDGVAKITKTVA